MPVDISETKIVAGYLMAASLSKAEDEFQI